MNHHIRRTLAGVAVLASIVVVDAFATDRGVFGEGVPLLDPGWLVRSAIIAIAGWLVVTGLDGVAAPWRRPTVTEPQVMIGAVISIIVLGGTAALMVADPEALNRLVTEDGWVEWLSALVWFAAAGVLLWAVLGPWRDRPLWPVRAGMVALAGLYLFIALEEVSWFQRVFDIETRGRFLENGQKEINLHNFATTFSGQSFFLGTFLFGALIAFTLDATDPPDRVRPYQPLVPGRATIVLVGAASALTYETWNIALFQFAFFASVVILALTARRTGDPLVATTAVVAVVVQVVSLRHGDEMLRAWDESEVRESLIPIGYFFHALALRRGPDGTAAGEATRHGSDAVGRGA